MRPPFSLLLSLLLLLLAGCGGEEFVDDVGGTPQSWRLVDGAADTKAETPEGAVARATTIAAAATRTTAVPTFTLQPGAAAIVNTRRSTGAGAVSDGPKDVPASGNTDVMTPKSGSEAGSGNAGRATPTPAGTPTITPTPGPPTITPSPTPIPTATPIPSASNAPRFPETPVQPFDPAAFRETLRLIDDSMRSFEQNWLLILNEQRDRNRGDCGSFLGWYTLWVTQAPAFTDVPPAWNDLVYNYRTFLADAVYYSSPIQRQCPGTTTTIRINKQLTIDFFTTAHAYSSELQRQAAALP